MKNRMEEHGDKDSFHEMTGNQERTEDQISIRMTTTEA